MERKNNNRYVDKSKNKEILNRLALHYNVKYDKEVLEKWGKNPTAMNNWRKSGIPRNELALLAIKEKLNMEWIINGEGDKYEKKSSMPDPHLAGIVEESGSIYEKNLCKALSKVDEDKKRIASQDAIEAIIKYY